ncbi:DNA cytosine methyltransferase [Micromonospora sp. C28SCA-DRY-2]|uniref:DNA cytosine methyltransferase n=1 Tax=Micromonospora sp. C28SCA-DRY-2 TaxID=3059522 RepID=UPI002675FE38|nr:DNA cytosine methyltransferase [Micromonospora sp. C28SCA-DRY-2]MDO3702706.1 DNA cytosine methyltransferase [Micromonospora sp. C28SCA-DRY-2]
MTSHRSSPLHPLRTVERPAFEEGDGPLRIVDLFSGCGGLTLGVAQAAASHGLALDVRLAVDFDEAAVGVYRANFPKAHTQLAAVETLVDAPLGSDLSTAEEALAIAVGNPVHALVAGPPCQGHSDLNNHTRRSDPKNELYLRVARAAEVLRPRAVMIENVPAVKHDRANVVSATISQLEQLGYQVHDSVVGLDRLGVAQRRRRHVLVAVTSDMTPPAVLLGGLGQVDARDLRWAIGDLADIAEPQGWDRPSRVSADNLARMRWLLDHDAFDLPNDLRPRCHQGNHSYKSMYGRLRWDQPAQTVTSGFGSIGQGRYMHPDQPRALTPHEAARIQGFPDYFRFEQVASRGALATMIGNAVPPALGLAIFDALIPEMGITAR